MILMALNIIVAIVTGFGQNYATIFANNFTLTLQHLQLYRLITSMFYHYGLLHLMCNMSCLLSLGLVTEEIFGKKKFVIAYFATGIIGETIALFIHQLMGQNVLSAGASGCIFGLLGLLIASMPGDIKTKIKTSIINFLPVLLIGLVGNIDNATHIACFLVGVLISPLLKNNKK